MSRFAVWAVSDRQHAEQAARSVASVRANVPGVTTVLLSPLAAFDGFDLCYSMGPVLARQWFTHRVLWYEKSLRHFDENDHVLFLDTDIHIAEPIEDVFAILERFELAGVHNCSRQVGPPPLSVPHAFCDINGGMLAVRVCDSIRRLFARWSQLQAAYDLQSREPNDQPALRAALWEWLGRFYVMPSEYNIQWHLGGFAAGRVRIIHGWSNDYAKSVQQLNEHWDRYGHGIRVWEGGTIP